MTYGKSLSNLLVAHSMPKNSALMETLMPSTFFCERRISVSVRAFCDA